MIEISGEGAGTGFGVTFVVGDKDSRLTSIELLWRLYYRFCLSFTPGPGKSVVDFEQEIVCWDMKWCPNVSESKNVLRFH